MRAKGMTWFRLPLFCWAQEVTQALVVLPHRSSPGRC